MRAHSTQHTAHSKGRIFVISGPSGSGKTTLRDRLFQDNLLKGLLAKSVSFTTRPRRSGERDGRDYFFITQGGFNQHRKNKKILEWTRYLGYYYATSRDFVEGAINKGRHIVLCLDLKGALKIRQLYPKDTRTIFIKPPSVAVLRKRIEGRCEHTRRKEISLRLRLAKRELKEENRHDYAVENKSLQQAVKSLRNIILGELSKRRG